MVSDTQNKRGRAAGGPVAPGGRGALVARAEGRTSFGRFSRIKTILSDLVATRFHGTVRIKFRAGVPVFIELTRCIALDPQLAGGGSEDAVP